MSDESEQAREQDDYCGAILWVAVQFSCHSYQSQKTSGFQKSKQSCCLKWNKNKVLKSTEGFEIKMSSFLALLCVWPTNRRYLRYQPYLHVLKDLWDKSNVTWLLRDKEKTKFASTPNRDRVCLFYQSDTVMQNVQFEFRPDLRHYCLLWGHLRSLLPGYCIQKRNNDPFTHNLPLLSLRWKVLHFLLSRINKLDRHSCIGIERWGRKL